MEDKAVTTGYRLTSAMRSAANLCSDDEVRVTLQHGRIRTDGVFECTNGVVLIRVTPPPGVTPENEILIHKEVLRRIHEKAGWDIVDLSETDKGIVGHIPRGNKAAPLPVIIDNRAKSLKCPYPNNTDELFPLKEPVFEIGVSIGQLYELIAVLKKCIMGDHPQMLTSGIVDERGEFLHRLRLKFYGDKEAIYWECVDEAKDGETISGLLMPTVLPEEDGES